MEQQIELNPQALTVTKEISELYSEIDSVQIDNQDQYDNAAGVMREIKAHAKRLDETRKAMTRPLDEAKYRIMQFFRNPEEVLANAERAIRTAMIAFDRKRQEEIEAARRLAEAHARELERAEKERLALEAERALAEGAAIKAMEAIAKAETLQVAAPVINAPKTEGISYRTLWKARVVDFSKLADEFKLPNEKKLGELARSQKGANPPEGVEFYSEKVIAAR